MIVILLGLPGSGKGTQSQYLKDHLDLYYLSTGDLIRQIIADNKEESIELNQYIKAGQLVPGHIINKLVEKFFSVKNSNKNYLLDGYPRTIEQAKFLAEITKEQLKVIYFEVEEDIVIKRISGRYSCSNCGRIYNKWYDNTLIKDICDGCKGSYFTEREDDATEIVAKRIIEHRNEIFPLIEYYKKLNLLHVINADRNKEEVSHDLLQVLKMI